MNPSTPPPRTVVYARSIDPVEVGGQVRQLRHLIRERGWEVAGVFSDKGKSNGRRPELDRLLQSVASGSVDLVVTAGLDIERARRLRAEGASLREVARTLKVGLGTIHQALQEAL